MITQKRSTLLYPRWMSYASTDLLLYIKTCLTLSRAPCNIGQQSTEVICWWEGEGAAQDGTAHAQSGGDLPLQSMSDYQYQQSNHSHLLPFQAGFLLSISLVFFSFFPWRLQFIFRHSAIPRGIPLSFSSL